MRRLLVIMTMALSIAATHQAQVPGIPGMQRAEPEVDLPKFDLDFPGGTPQELVDAIRAEIGKLNAIIPT